MTSTFSNASGRNFLLAALSGILLTASFPKMAWSPLAWVALVPLLWAIRRGPISKGFKVGFLAGIVHYATLLYWITNVMEVYGGLNRMVSWAIVFLLVAYLSLYMGLFCWGVMVLRARNPLFIWFAPCLWGGLEYCRSFLLSGFPWENLGCSQFDWLHVIQISDIFGVYGVSALIAAVNIWQFQCLEAVHEKKEVPWIALLSLVLLLGGTLGYGAWRIKEIDQEAANAPEYAFTVVQGNIDQSQKWLPSFQEETLRRYGRLTRTTQKDRPTLIIWPETALPFYFLRNDALTDQVLQLVREMNNHFVFGSPSWEPVEDVEAEGKDEGKVRYFNSAYIIEPSGNVAGRYDKVHLVPYGEYVPLKRFFPFFGKIAEAVGDFETGREGQALSWNGKKLGVLICFEVIFPELARSMARNDAQVLVNITNDAWFGRSSAPYQHLSMAVLRVVETRRAMARAANTGISAFIDPAGRILDKTPLFEEAARTRALPLMSRNTFYTRYGDLFAVACVTLSAAVLVFAYRTGVGNIALKKT